jgi:hypothetical protein
MRTTWLLTLAPLLVGCIVLERETSPAFGCETGCDGVSADLEHLSVHRVDDRYQLSFTTEPGTLACGLSESEHRELGIRGTQVFVALDEPWAPGCPDGIHPIGGPDCQDHELEPGCARLRSWDAHGGITTETRASGGSLVVDDVMGGCRYEGELVFPGGHVVLVAGTVDDLGWPEDQTCTAH